MSSVWVVLIFFSSVWLVFFIISLCYARLFQNLMKNTLRCELSGQRIEMCTCLPSQLSYWPCLFDGTPRFNSSVFLSDPECVSFSPVPVLHIQLYPGPDLLLRVPEGELWVKNADHDGGAGGLQHHSAPHPRPCLGCIQPGPVSEVSRPAPLSLITLMAIMVLWSYVQWKLIKAAALSNLSEFLWNDGSGIWGVFSFLIIEYVLRDACREYARVKRKDLYNMNPSYPTPAPLGVPVLPRLDWAPGLQ